MDDSQESKETAQLIASEASAGAKGGRGDDLSGSDKVALKKKKNREKHIICYEFRCDPDSKWWSHKSNGPGGIL
jgi:hypothetical protein